MVTRLNSGPRLPDFQILAWPLLSCVPLDKSFNFSVHQDTHSVHVSLPICMMEIRTALICHRTVEKIKLLHVQSA